MKTYVLIVSQVFGKKHRRSGEPTNFREKILSGEKIHTIRAAFATWKKRIEEVQAGEAVISVRYWSGKPYNSKQLRICELDKSSGVGIQCLKMTMHFNDPSNESKCYVVHNEFNEGTFVPMETLANNDGLTLDDFTDWFRHYDLMAYNQPKPLAIIHFSGKVRY